MSFKKRSDWVRKQIYKEIYESNDNPYKKKKYLEQQSKIMSEKMTAPEKAFEKLMREMGIECMSQRIVTDVIYDFYLPKTNTLIEIDGDYYHGNPEVYQEGDLNKMQAKNKKKDHHKTNLAKGLGYNFERIWEKEINEDLSLIKKRFKKYL